MTLRRDLKWAISLFAFLPPPAHSQRTSMFQLRVLLEFMCTAFQHTNVSLAWKNAAPTRRMDWDSLEVKETQTWIFDWWSWQPMCMSEISRFTGSPVPHLQVWFTSLTSPELCPGSGYPHRRQICLCHIHVLVFPFTIAFSLKSAPCCTSRWLRVKRLLGWYSSLSFFRCREPYDYLLGTRAVAIHLFDSLTIR